MNIYQILIKIQDPQHVAVEVARNDYMYLQLNEDGRRVVDDIMRVMTDAGAKFLGSAVVAVEDSRPPVVDEPNFFDAPMTIDEGIDHI